jgi:hypothetical protein
MEVQSRTTSASAGASQPSEISRVYVEGISAGILGAATIAIWFFVLDVFNGRPFYTPSILGSALFRRGVGIDQLQTLSISVEMVLIYTWVHGLAFCVIGGVASKLLELAERNVNLGFGILLFFVIFEFGFAVSALVFAEPILHALAWPAVLMGNFLAAAVMGLYFWRHHPNLSIRP